MRQGHNLDLSAVAYKDGDSAGVSYECRSVDALAIPSEAVVRGSIQVGGDGAATVLLADHQTTGGYPKIATLVASAVDSFAQVRPRAPVRFRAIDTAAAVRLARRQAAVERGVLAALDRR